MSQAWSESLTDAMNVFGGMVGFVGRNVTITEDAKHSLISNLHCVLYMHPDGDAGTTWQ